MFSHVSFQVVSVSRGEALSVGLTADMFESEVGDKFSILTLFALLYTTACTSTLGVNFNNCFTVYTDC